MGDTFISQNTDPSTLSTSPKNVGFLNPKRRRVWREYLTGYAMIAPAMILIFVFGLFPVAFALYVSLHKWRLVRTEFIGIDHYLSALDNLFLFILFMLGVAGIFAAYKMVRGMHAKIVENKDLSSWLLLIPSTAYTATIIAFVRYAYLQLPEVLDIADKIRGQERTRGLFIGLLGEAFRAETVQPAWQLFLSLLAACYSPSPAVQLVHTLFRQSRLSSKNDLDVAGTRRGNWAVVGHLSRDSTRL